MYSGNVEGFEPVASLDDLGLFARVFWRSSALTPTFAMLGRLGQALCRAREAVQKRSAERS
jgi:hypothetical protein